jgi:hypothetical protein
MRWADSARLQVLGLAPLTWRAKLRGFDRLSGDAQAAGPLQAQSPSALR